MVKLLLTTPTPLTGETTTTKAETTVITVTSCADDKCAESTVPATKGETTSVNESGETTTYTTWCPVTSTVAGEETPAPTTAAGEETPAPVAPSTVAGESTTLASSAVAAASSGSPISTYAGAGNKAASSLLAVALVPLAGLLL